MKKFSFLLVFVFSFGLFGNTIAEQTIFSENFNSDPSFTSMDSGYAYWDSSEGNYYVNSRDNLNHKSWAYSSKFSTASTNEDITIEFDIVFENQDWGTYPGVRFYDTEPSDFINTVPIFRVDSAYRNSYVKQIGIYDNEGNQYYTPRVDNGVWHHIKIQYNSGGTADIDVTELDTSKSIYSKKAVAFQISDFSYLGVGYYGAPDYGSDFSPIRLDNMSISYPNKTNSCTSAEAGTVSSDLNIHMPSLDYQTLFGTQNIWVNFEYYGKGSNGELLWKLKDYGTNN